MKQNLLDQIAYEIEYHAPISERTPGTVEELQKLRVYKKNARENARRLQAAYQEQKRIAGLYYRQRDFYRCKNNCGADASFMIGFFTGIVFGAITTWIFLQA